MKDNNNSHASIARLPTPVATTAAPASSACATCPAHNAGNLLKLGVDMTDWDYVVALAGNPNTGKSTVFNALTGLRQHTGNWPGKTVTRAEGGFSYSDKQYKLVDLPGTYSLLSTSLDEEVARDFLLFGQPDVTVIVVDATRLERNLNLVLQVLEITDRAVICLNLIDEARRHKPESGRAAAGARFRRAGSAHGRAPGRRLKRIAASCQRRGVTAKLCANRTASRRNRRPFNRR
jgi:50S ribosomal subunit-associated GTPase HflX